MFEFTKGNVGFYVSKKCVPTINPLERKCFIDHFMYTFGSMQVILLSRVIVIDITIFDNLFAYHLGKKPLLSLNINRLTLYATIFVNGIISSDKNNL